MYSLLSAVPFFLCPFSVDNISGSMLCATTEQMINDKRIRILRNADQGKGPVVYWMSRDQRVEDNWALLYAQQVARERREPLIVVFCLVPKFLGATLRHYSFMLAGLEEVEAGLAKKNISFVLLNGNPRDEIPTFILRHRVAVLVTDFDPLRIKRQWKKGVAKKIAVPFHEVDAHNIIPCWIASPKQEFGAYTLRPKMRRTLPDYLEPFPRLKRHPYPWKGSVRKTSWRAVSKGLTVDRSVGEVLWIRPGEKAARKALRSFIRNRLHSYDRDRNDPNLKGQSDLSPYLHFGHLSAQRAAMEVMKSRGNRESKDAFLEELIVRRELSDNFCLYQENYDGFEGFPDWAKKTLNRHRRDRREHDYSLKDFEQPRTHDALWNAAQMEMVRRGKMHGYMRMYWAKKILEWTDSPETAMKIAIRLNDKYELDGRDPNGYTGIAWSIGGVHDRAWSERPVFGKIRYMSANGCRSKFDVQAYIDAVNALKA